MAIKIAESALKRTVGRVSGNTGIFLGLIHVDDKDFFLKVNSVYT